ncbi:hypothetical protein [Alkalibaculum bacchi]|uniref:hypothetical protein n=1 Tax=Alkalibaculum bacchi TaxID=645887 RepID=UPI0026EA328C|nr:hypothetical protein [Alkalibaculum bacchi]
MDIINELVKHDNFGEGSIIKYNDNVVEIKFETGNKKFIFPDAFASYLTILDQNIASDIKKLIEENEIERKKIELEIEHKKMIETQERERRLEVEKFMKSNKIHPSSQAVFWCQEEDIEQVFADWMVYTGVIKSGIKKGEPNRPIRMHQNSACLLTQRDSGEPEDRRKIIGVYMVHETFSGNQCEDGYIPAHSIYKIRLSEEESQKMLFWNYYINKRYPQNTTWNTGIYRYFENIYMAQILRDIAYLKPEGKEKEIAQNFYKHFCKMNNLVENQIPQPNGVLKQNNNSVAEATV